MLDLAESDPARFRAECAALAAKLGTSVEDVYQMLQGEGGRERLKNVAVLAAVKFARRTFAL
jgi:hypothetical protein